MKGLRDGVICEDLKGLDRKLAKRHGGATATMADNCTSINTNPTLFHFGCAI